MSNGTPSVCQRCGGSVTCYSCSDKPPLSFVEALKITGASQEVIDAAASAEKELRQRRQERARAAAQRPRS